MSQWERLKQSYITQFSPTKEEQKKIPISFFNTFIINKLGTRTLFAQFNGHIITKQTGPWTYL
jgi:hypothetical protein